MLAFPQSVPVLTCGRVLLRAMNEADLPAWYERLRDAEAAQMAGDPIAESISVCAAGLAHHRRTFAEGSGIRWSIVPTGSQAAVGSIGLTRIDHDDWSAELGGAVARAWWRRGIATSAAELVIRYAFEVMQIDRIRAQALTFNGASIRVLEKLGFARVGQVGDDVQYQRINERTDRTGG